MVATVVELRDGTREAFYSPRVPKHWKSWTMRQMPYGTDFQGCTFELWVDIDTGESRRVA